MQGLVISPALDLADLSPVSVPLSRVPPNDDQHCYLNCRDWWLLLMRFFSVPGPELHVSLNGGKAADFVGTAE